MTAQPWRKTKDTNKNWKAADQETADRMCEVMNRQEEGGLFIDDIKNFPCQDLLNIDHLWVEYSNNRFGFSAQKEIYLECGGELVPFSNSKSLVRNIEKFGDRVGWRAKGIWQYHADITSNPFIPKAYFPFKWIHSCNFMPEEFLEELSSLFPARLYGRLASTMLFRLQPGKAVICFVSLFSRAEECEMYLHET